MAKGEQEMNKKISFDIEFKEFGYDHRYPFSGFDNLKKDMLIKSQSKSETGFKKIKITKTQ
jgi:hypothetical protein